MSDIIQISVLPTGQSQTLPTITFIDRRQSCATNVIHDTECVRPNGSKPLMSAIV